MSVHQQILSVKVSVVNSVMEALKKSGLHLTLVTKVSDNKLDEMCDFFG
jgi:hypothetical protein